MVDSEGTGFVDFTTETAISGTANISGNIVGISGEIVASGAVSIIGNFMYRPKIMAVTGASGGEALGSGLTTSGYTVYNVKIKMPENRASGVPNWNLVRNSGEILQYVYIGGYSGDAPYPGSGFLYSGKGYLLSPGEAIVVSVDSLSKVYAASESSGNLISYLVEMR